MKTHLLLVSIFILSSVAHAQRLPLSADLGETDYISSVRLNGIELSEGISYQEMHTIFGSQTIEQETTFSDECTGNYNAVINYNGKSARLEYFPEMNEINLELLFSDDQTIHGYQQSPAQASLWVKWSDMSNFTETLTINDKVISPQLTESEFKELFPISATHGVSYEDEPNITYYYIAFASTEYIEELQQNNQIYSYVYDGAVTMTFINGKLHEIFISHGLAC